MRYYIIAGEASGDLHASYLMKSLREKDPGVVFRCWGGNLMKEQGGELVKHFREMAFMGFLEVATNLRTILRNMKLCREDILSFRPDVVILVDYPGFNLRIARFLKRKGIRTFYYISPQLWAWRSSRVKIIRDCVSRMFVILPFEKDFYHQHGVEVDYTGHPLLDEIGERPGEEARKLFYRENNLDEKPLIALLPGSRRQEIKKILEVMVKVIPGFPSFQFVIAAAPSVDIGLYRKITGDLPVKVVAGQTGTLLHYAHAALVTSGTATLETALHNVPQVVCYKGSLFSYMIARLVVHVRYISLVNLIMEKETVRELIQDDLTGENLSSELRKITEDQACRNQVLDDYAVLKEKLGGKGASSRAAELMVQYLSENSVKK